MAQRFYFDLTIGTFTIRDDKGAEANDIDHATEDAQIVLDEMRDSEETSALKNDWHMSIRGEAGTTLKTLPFA